MLLLTALFLAPLVLWSIISLSMGLPSYPRWLAYQRGKLGIDAMLVLGFMVAGCVALVVQSGVLDVCMPKALLVHSRNSIEGKYFAMLPEPAYVRFLLQTQEEQRTVRIATPYTRPVAFSWSASPLPGCGPALAEHPPILSVTIFSTTGNVLVNDVFPLGWDNQKEAPPQWRTVIPQQNDRMAIATITVTEAAPETRQCAHGFGLRVQELVH